MSGIWKILKWEIWNTFDWCAFLAPAIENADVKPAKAKGRRIKTKENFIKSKEITLFPGQSLPIVSFLRS